MKTFKIVITGVLGLLLNLSAAQAAGWKTSCQVPGFLNFTLETKASSALTELHINQHAYGLAHGPATTLANSLGLSPSSGPATVQSLSVHQPSIDQDATAIFVFTDGSTIQVDLGHVQLSLHDGTYRNNGLTYPAKILDLSSSAGLLLSIPAQANLCSESLEGASARTLLKAIEPVTLPRHTDCDPSNAPPICGHGSYAPRCLCGS